MDDKRLDNFENSLIGAVDSEQEMSALFARFLPDEPIPPDLVERTQRIVLSEVRRTIHPALGAQQAPAGSWPERLRHWWRSLTPAQSLAMSGVVAALVLVLLIGLTQLTPQTIAVVAAVNEGTVLVLRDENSSFRTFYAGDMLKVDEGDHVITGESSVVLKPFELQKALLEPGTHLEIVDLEDDFGNTQVEYLVHSGALHNVIDDKLDANDRYVVRSPLLAVSATGTDFTVETLSGANTRVTVTAGTVIVQMGDQTVKVAAGQFLNAMAGAPLQVETSGQAGQDSGDTLVVTDIDATPLPVYAAPSVDAAVVGTIGEGAVLRVEDRDSSGAWFRVCCVDDLSGWVNVAELAADNPPADDNRKASDAPAGGASAMDTPPISETTPISSLPSP